MSQPIRGQDGHLGFPIGPINKSLEENVHVLLPVNFVEFRSAVSQKLKMSQPMGGRIHGSLSRYCGLISTKPLSDFNDCLFLDRGVSRLRILLFHCQHQTLQSIDSRILSILHSRYFLYTGLIIYICDLRHALIEKGRDLLVTQSYDRSPYTDGKLKKAK